MLSLLGSFLILLGRVAKVLSHPDDAAYIRIIQKAEIKNRIRTQRAKIPK